MKKRLPTIILIGIFILGLLILLYPTISDQWNKRTSSRAIASYDEALAVLGEQVDYTSLWEAAENYNEMITEKGSLAMMDDAQMEEINHLFPEADNTEYYELEADGYRLVASVQEPADALEGALRRMQVSIIQDGYIRVTLPCSRYVEDAA